LKSELAYNFYGGSGSKILPKTVRSNQNICLTKEKGCLEFVFPLLLGHGTNIVLPLSFVWKVSKMVLKLDVID
jgi:hypothetical protein